MLDLQIYCFVDESYKSSSEMKIWTHNSYLKLLFSLEVSEQVS